MSSTTSAWLSPISQPPARSTPRRSESLGFGVVMEFPGVIALGLPQKPELWMHQGTPSAPIHLAFHATDRGRVDAFHAAALAAGGTDNGPPGLRPQPFADSR